MLGPFTVYVDTDTGQQTLLPATQGGGSGPSRDLLCSLQASLTAALAWSAREWVSAMFVDCTLVGGKHEIIVPFPVTGTLARVAMACNFAPDQQMRLLVTVSGLQAAGLVVPAATPAGTVIASDATQNNAGTYGTSAVRVVHQAPSNTVTGRAFLVFGFAPA